jgi:hypothetical protein
VVQFNAFQPLKLVTGQGRSVSPVTGNISLYGKFDGYGEDFGIALNGTADFNRTFIIGTGTSGPFSGTIVKSFDEPAISADGNSVMKMALTGTGVTAGNDSAIVRTGTGGSDTYIYSLRTGGAATDGTGGATSWVYSKFSDPVINDNDDIAFIAGLKTDAAAGVTPASDSGIWSNWNGALELVARTGQPAPGASGTFSAFTQLVLPDLDGPFFEARLSGVAKTENLGLWNAGAGQSLTLVIATGQQLSVHGNVKTVKSFSVFPIVPYCGGQSRSFSTTGRRAIFSVTFTDKSWAIYAWPPTG